MQKSFIRHIFTVSILSCCLLFGGCSQNSAGEETSSATTASPSPSETVAALPADVSPDSDTSAIESTSEDTSTHPVGSQYVWHRSRYGSGH